MVRIFRVDLDEIRWSVAAVRLLIGETVAVGYRRSSANKPYRATGRYIADHCRKTDLRPFRVKGYSMVISKVPA